jgi:hypothetical protein
MTLDISIETLFSPYEDQLSKKAVKLRNVILENLPEILEQVDVPARMIAYCYGQKNTELICVVIPSKKGLKLGFNKGNELPDPNNLLQGTGKISRYVEINSEKLIASAAIKNLIISAHDNYKQRINKINLK